MIYSIEVRGGTETHVCSELETRLLPEVLKSHLGDDSADDQSFTTRDAAFEVKGHFRGGKVIVVIT
jgi:hypothetical protein